jgi:hypothetical protein
MWITDKKQPYLVAIMTKPQHNVIADNGLRLGEGCLTESSKFAQCLWQLLPNRCYVLGGLSALNLI